MTEQFFTPQRMLDTADEFITLATKSGGAPEFDTTIPPAPAYAGVAADFHKDATAPWFELARGADGIVAGQQAAALARHPGLRVLVRVRVPSLTGPARDVYAPGIVLPSEEGTGTNIGCLMAGPDIVATEGELTARATRPLSDFQQGMLMRFYGLHNKGVGRHHNTDTHANVGDTADAAVIVSSNPNRLANLHGVVHASIRTGLASSISQGGATAVQAGGRLRPDLPVVVPANRAGRIIVPKEHQLPPADTVAQLGSGLWAVAATLAAVRTKKEDGFPQPDLSAGIEALS